MLIPVILSGGAGTRLWPVSREGHPKPFMTLPDGQSLLEQDLSACRRIAGRLGRHRYGDQPRILLPEQGSLLRRPCRAIADTPAGADRAHTPAIAAAALSLQALHGDDAIMVVMPADHLIVNQQALKSAVEHAVNLAKDGYLVTFGVLPTAPETGFGYIETGAPLDAEGAAKVQRFVEKPDLQTATHYLESGNFLWNSGMFCFTTATLINELQLHAPELLEQTAPAWRPAPRWKPSAVCNRNCQQRCSLKSPTSPSITR
jgi:mannose-1-phosphate guanylyltransferase